MSRYIVSDFPNCGKYNPITTHYHLGNSAGVYIEPSQTQITGSNRLKEGSNLNDKEVFLIIRGIYSQVFFKLWDRVFQILIIGQK